MRARAEFAVVALLCLGCAQEAAPGVRVGAEVRVRGVDGLPAGVQRVNAVDGTRAQVGTVWVDFAKVTAYEVGPAK